MLGYTPLKIRSEMVVLGITGASVAKALKISRQAVSEVIHGKKKNPRIRQAIAAALGRPVAEIWPDADKKIPRPPSNE